jgi:hypothetical protein
VWNGEKLLHDPTFTIYYEEQIREETPNSPDAAISGYNTFIVVAFASVFIVLHLLRQKNRIKT